MPDQPILVSPGAITRIVLNRPEVHNAIDLALGDALLEAIREAGLSPDVKVIVIEGAGKSFCSGDDRGQSQYRSDDVEPFGLLRAPIFNLMPLIRRVPKPVVAKVHGYCTAGGAELVLAADFAVADPGTRFGMIFGHIGLAVGAVFLPKYLGLKRANEVLFRPELLSAQEAWELGLLTRVAAPGELEKETAALAERLAEEQTRYFAHFGLLKEAINRNLYPTLEEDMRFQAFNVKLNWFYQASHPGPDDQPQTSSWIKAR